MKFLVTKHKEVSFLVEAPDRASAYNLAVKRPQDRTDKVEEAIEVRHGVD